MMLVPTPVEQVRPLSRREAAARAAVENERVADLVRSLSDEDWGRPTDCADWDVRAMVAHMLGMMEFVSSLREFVHVLRAGSRAAAGRPMIDGMTEVQVLDRAHLSTEQLRERLTVMAPRAARARRRLPGPLRRLPLKEEVEGEPETWRLGYLFDVILTRDAWMHRIDLTRATGRAMVLSAEHDGRIVADVVAEWARRHGRPFTLVLEGPAGGVYTGGAGGERITLDAVEYCRLLSGRGTGNGLLARRVPF